jgi:hypothetical protein
VKIATYRCSGLIVGLMVLSAPVLAYVTTVNGTGLGVIPDGPSLTCGTPGTPLNTSFVVSGVTGSIQDIRVSITFSPAHSWGGDVTATLVAPGGSPAFVLFGRRGAVTGSPCGGNADLAGPYVFVDPSVSSNNFWSDTSTPVTAGTYMTTPEGGAGVSNAPAGTPFIATFSGLTPAQINGTWTLRFTDSGSGDTGSVSATAMTLDYYSPDTAPIAGAVTAGNSQAWLGFTPPVSNGGSPITGYTATCTPLGSGTAGPDARTILVTGLRNDVPSTCDVRATNAYGSGAPLTVDITSHAAVLGFNDSGQNRCVDGSNLVACTSANAGNATSYSRQDGRFGRDAAATAGVLTKTGGGNAGFDFTRLCNSGEPAGSGSCPASPVQGSGANEWGCTRDNVTGLVWLLETSVGNWTYATETYPTTANTAGRCGYTTGWWLPTLSELVSIIDIGQTESLATIDQNYFPGDYTSAMTVAWSATPAATSLAWYVWFAQGLTYANLKSNDQLSVRLVHPGTGTGAFGYTDHGDGTISNNATTLMWDKCLWGLSGENCTTGVAQTGSWSQALGMATSANAINYLGHADWRLPSVRELQSLIDFTRNSPATDPVFPLLPAPLWSGTPWSVTDAMYVTLSEGISNHTGYPEAVPVRLVRGGQSFSAFDLLAPLAPTIDTATAGNGKVTIRFTPAASGPTATTYTANCTDGSTLRSVIGSTSPIIVSSLTNNLTVSCSVTAANTEGSSLSSAALNATPHATAPDAPSLLRLIPGDRRMKVLFSTSASDGGAAITGYVASCTGGGHTYTSSPPTLTSPITVTGLTNNVSYTCSVHANNSVGSSSESATAVKVVKRLAGIAPLLGILLD